MRLHRQIKPRYTLTVVVTDNDNETATASVVITVRAVPITDTNPTANITTPNQTISAGSSITLALTAGHGGDGQALTYLWSATGGTFNSTSTQNPVWTSPSPTNETQYILTARVTDEDGNFVTDTVTITVEAAAITDTNPTVSISTATGQTVDFGTAFPVASTQGTGGDSDILTGIWSSTPAGGTFAAPANANTTFSASPAVQTTFILRRTVEDENSNTATDTITLTVRAAGVSPLAFSDWSPPAGSETRLLMLVSRGASNEWYREGNSGSLIDNSNALFDDILAPDLQVNRIRWNGSVVVMNRSGSGSFSDQLSGTDPPLGEGLLHVVTADGAITLAISLIAGIGDGFVSFRPTAQSVIDFLEGVGLGDRFLFAFTIPGVTNTAPTISITTAGSLVDGAASVSLAGAVGDAEDDDANVGLTVTASRGTITNLTHTGSGWTATWTAPAVTAAQQTATISATATDSESLTATATTDFMVRANVGPTVMITAPTSAQTVDGGDAINLTATASAPEAGQTVTIAWSSNIGTFTDSGGTTARWVAPAITNAVQNATITATATDALNETATDTLAVSVRANTAPSVSIDTSAQTVDGGGTLALTASVSDPEGQTLTHLWEITSGAGSITNSTSLSATLNLPAATTSVQTIAIRITTTDPLNLTGTDTVTITVRVADAVSLLVLSDFVAPDGTEIACSGLFTSGVPTNSGGVERLWGRIPRAPWGTLTDGNFTFDGVSINEIRRAANGSNFRLLKNGGTGFNSYFATDGGGENARFYILTAETTIEFDAVANILAPSGGNFFNFTVPDTAGWRSALSSIVAGDRFIMGWTVPSTAPDLMPTAPTIPDRAGTVGTAFSYTLPLATGGDTPITTTADVLPGGLSLTSGVISGTPTAAGTTTVTITYTDNDGDTDTASFDFVVAAAADLMPVAPTIPDRTATVGTAFSYTLPLATSGDAPVTATADTLPAGLTLTSGAISGTPTATGTTTVTITYTDNDGDSDTAAFDFVVSAATSEVATLFIVDSSGDELWELADPSSPGTSVLRGNFPGGLTVPTGITSHDGSLWIIDNSGDELWEVADPSNPGAAVLRGDFPANLSSPRGITSHSGSLWIVDDTGDELWELANPSSPGTAVLRGEFPFSLSFSAALTSHGGSLFITDRSGGELWELADPSSPASAVLRGTFPSGLTSQRGITSHDGSLFIVDDSGNELWELADPSNPGTAVNRGSFPSDLSTPSGITSHSTPAPDLMPVAPAVADRTATVGTSYSQTLPVFSGGDGTLTYTATPLPAGLTFNATTRLISGSPTTVQTTTVIYEAEDSDGDTASVSFDITVGAADLMPTAAAIADQSAIVGTAFSLTFDAAIGGDTPITYSVTGNPTWLTLAGRTLSGTPTAVGTHTITITAEDVDGDTDSVSFVLSVEAADLTPSLPAIANQSATVGIQFDLTFTAATSGNPPLTYSVTGNPTWLTLAGRTLSGLPNAAGMHSITITVTDADGDTDSETFNIFVVEEDVTPTAPVISNQTATVGITYSQTLAVATGGNAPLTYTASGLPAGLTFNTNAREISGIPTADGTFTVTYTVEDADGDTDDTTFDIVVAEGNVSPVAPDITNQTGTVGTIYNQTLMVATGGNAPITYSISGLPPGLSFNVNSRRITGTPTTADTYTVTYTVTDTDGDSDDDTFRIVINVEDITPSIPAISDQVATVAIEYTQTLAEATGGNTPLTYSVEDLPPGLIFTASTRLINGTPTSSGTYTVTYTVTDVDNDSDDTTFDIVVNETPAGISLFDDLISNATIGVAWLGTTPSHTQRNFGVRTVDERSSITRVNEAIDTRFISSGEIAYVTTVIFQTDGRLRFEFSSSPDQSGGATDGPQLTDYAETGLGFAIQLEDGTEYKWRLSDLTSSDDTEPYLFSAASLVATGIPNDDDLRTAVLASATVKHVLVEISNSNIDWNSLRATLTGLDVVPIAPTIANKTATLGVETTFTLPGGTGGNPPLSYNLADRPLGMTFDADTRIVTWTPLITGTFLLRYQITDSDNDLVEVLFTIVASGIDTSPSLSVIADQTTIVGTTFSLTITAATGGNGILKYVAVGIPNGLVFDAIALTISGRAASAGTHIVRITVTDGNFDSDSSEFTFTINARIRTGGITPANYYLEIDWDGDGFFSNPDVDVSIDLSDTTIKTTRGRDFASMVYGRSVAGKLSCRLKDFENKYARFNNASPLFGLVVPQREIKLFMETSVLGKQEIWSGYLDRPKRQKKRGGQTWLEIYALDILSKLVAEEVSVPVSRMTTTSEAMVAILDEASISNDKRGTIAGSTIMAIHWSLSQAALRAAREIEETEGGFIYVDRFGNIHFADNDHRIVGDAGTSQITFTNLPDIMPYEVGCITLNPTDPTQDIANVVDVPIRSFSLSDETDLWESGIAISIPSNGKRTVVINFPSVNSPSSYLAANLWISPEAITDYVANSHADGLGDDLTGSISITTKPTSGKNILSISNSSNSTAYMTLLKVRGTALREDQAITIQIVNESSISVYDSRPYLAPSQFISTEVGAINYGQFVLQHTSEPLQKVDLSFVCTNDITFDLALNLELSDRVTVRSEEVNQDMFVESISHTITKGNKHVVGLTLSPAYFFDNVTILDLGPGLDTGQLGR